MYARIDEYQSPTFLKAWEKNHKRQKGSLVKQEFIDSSIYSDHLDDALGNFSTPESSTECSTKSIFF